MDGNAVNYLLNLANGKRYLLTTAVQSKVLLPDWTWPVVSPDRKWLVYFEQFDDPWRKELRIVSSDGEQQPVHDNERDYRMWDILGWLDDERLVLTNWANTEITLNIFNPFSGELEESLATPQVVSPQGDIFVGGPGTPLLIYNPALTRVVYDRFLRDQNRITYELWDVQSKNVLWERSVEVDYSRPVWSPDGKYFAIIYEPYSKSNDPYLDYGSLYIVNDEGQETMLTDMVAGELAWSPDGRYIATWWRGDIDFDIELPCWGANIDLDIELPCLWTNSLVIVDVITKDATIYSVGNASSAQHPVWSPDGNMVAVVAYREADEPVDDIATRVVIVDIVRNRAFEVVREARVRGWMTLEP